MQPDRPTLPIAARCYWYPQGDARLKPCLALVTNTNATGALNLAILRDGASAFGTKLSVRHASDPWLQTEFGKEAALKDGCWDFIVADVDAPQFALGAQSRSLDKKKEPAAARPANA